MVRSSFYAILIEHTCFMHEYSSLLFFVRAWGTVARTFDFTFGKFLGDSPTAFWLSIKLLTKANQLEHSSLSTCRIQMLNLIKTFQKVWYGLFFPHGQHNGGKGVPTTLPYRKEACVSFCVTFRNLQSITCFTRWIITIPRFLTNNTLAFFFSLLKIVMELL